MTSPVEDTRWAVKQERWKKYGIRRKKVSSWLKGRFRKRKETASSPSAYP
jgi:hypothetical protein